MPDLPTESAETVPLPAPEPLPSDEASPAAAAAVVDEAPAEKGADGAAGKTELNPAQTGAKLKELFPALFTALPVLPLKLRIQADIHARAPGVFTKKGLSIFLHRYTTGTPYLIALTQAPQRADLDGAPAGDIAAEHREAAAVELRQRREANAARRAAERAAAGAAKAQAVEANGAAAASTGAEAAEQIPQPAPRPARHQRPPQRPPGNGRPEQRARKPDQRPAQAHKPRLPQRTQQPPPQAASMPMPPSAPREPEDPARRERALLLRAFESSPLSRANFCALKRIGEAELEAALVLARVERGQR